MKPPTSLSPAPESQPETAPATHTLDPDAWIQNHHAYLTHVALGKLRNPSTAEDLVQDTFLAAWKARQKFAGRAAERTWLTRILLNKIADHYRADARKPSVAVSQLAQESSNEEVLDSLFQAGRDSYGTEDDGPATAAERAEFIRLVDEMLDEVPSQAAAAFRMRELQGLSTEDIVHKLDITPNHLWVLIHRAKKALRKKMEQVWELPTSTLAFSQPTACC